MPVDAVVRDIELAALEPLDAWYREVVVEDGVPLRVPVEVLLGELRPDALGVLDRALVEPLVFVHRLDVRVLRYPRGRLHDPVLRGQRFDRVRLRHACAPFFSTDAVRR